METQNTKEQEPEEDEKAEETSSILGEQNKSVIWGLIKQFKPGVELKHIQLPMFLLQPRSLLDKLTDSFVHPEIIFQVPKLKSPEERFIQIVKFYLSSWHYQPYKGARNPLNPIIGEIFKCHWTHPNDGSTSEYFAEQLSHHPPKSAFCYYNERNGIFMNGNLAPSYIKFFGNSVETHLKGLFRFHVFGKENGEEVYEATYPNIVVKGLLVGRLRYEMFGTVIISRQNSDLRAEIEFKAKGMLRGSYNCITGKIYKGNNVIHKLDGHWTDVINLIDGNSRKSVFFDPKEFQVHKKVIDQVDDPLESTKVWKGIVEGMLEDNEQKAMQAKIELEKKQRREVIERKEKKVEWQPRFFTENSGFWEYNKAEEIKKNIRTLFSQTATI